MPARWNDRMRRVGAAAKSVSRRVALAPDGIARGYRAAAHWLQRQLLLRMSLVWVERYAVLTWCATSIVNARVRWDGVIRYELGRDLFQLDASQRLRAMSADVLEKMIDRRLHFGRQRDPDETWPDLNEIAGMLATHIERIRRDTPGRPVIVAPFHYVSQYANIYVVDALRDRLGLEHLSVVSGVRRDQYGDDAALIPGIRVLYTYGDDNRSGLGVRVARSLRRDGVAVLFADVPPYTLHKYPMETVGVSILGRPARIHSGVFRIGGIVDAVLLPFYLTFERGRFGMHVFDGVELAAGDAPQRVADLVGVALTANYALSLVAGHPAMYSFCPVK